jgi:hypothetical protein
MFCAVCDARIDAFDAMRYAMSCAMPDLPYLNRIPFFIRLTQALTPDSALDSAGAQA